MELTDSLGAKEAGFDPADYMSPSEVAALLDDNWQVLFDVRPPPDGHRWSRCSPFA